MNINLRVAKIVDATPQIKVFSMENADGGPLPSFTAGAHVEFKLPVRHDRVEKRCYSMANDPKETGRYVFGILRDPKSTGGSSYLHDQVQEGDILEAIGPINNFPLNDTAEQHLLIAGGIGITPILSMARALTTAKAAYRLHYCARSPAEMAFKAEIEKLCGERALLQFDGGDPSRGLDLKALLSHFRLGRHVYVCGPRGLIEAVHSICSAAGWPEDHVHYEFFGAAANTESGEALEIVLANSNLVLRIQPGQSILDAVLDAGVDVDFDCKRGECGMCVTQVLEGKPLHRDVYLSGKERAAGDCICTCVSWAESDRLVLNL
jgi:vanillate monooxygenase ferredoxin subunit